MLFQQDGNMVGIQEPNVDEQRGFLMVTFRKQKEGQITKEQYLQVAKCRRVVDREVKAQNELRLAIIISYVRSKWNGTEVIGPLLGENRENMTEDKVKAYFASVFSLKEGRHQLWSSEGQELGL